MLYLILSIICSVLIALIFRALNRFEIKLFPIIVFNYLTATMLGIFLNENNFNLNNIVENSWFEIAILIGFLLIAGFYLIGYSTQKVGIAITTISNKMSVVLPMFFSILFYSESLNFMKILGIILALISLFLTIYHKKENNFDSKLIFLPILLFFAIGFIDTSIKIAQAEFLNENNIPLFTATSFGLAGLIGIILSFFNKLKIKDFLNLKTFIAGILLGAANFGSMYFSIYALNHSGLDSSIVFGINNIGIIIISIFLAVIFFKEKLKPINWIGFILSLVSILILVIFS